MTRTWTDAQEGEVLQTTAGRATVVDGWAAGHAWYLVKFDGGDLSDALGGHQVWLSGDRTDPSEATYLAAAVDDGDRFNAAGTLDVMMSYDVLGGAYLPDLDGLVVRIVS